MEIQSNNLNEVQQNKNLPVFKSDINEEEKPINFTIYKKTPYEMYNECKKDVHVKFEQDLIDGAVDGIKSALGGIKTGLGYCIDGFKEFAKENENEKATREFVVSNLRAGKSAIRNFLGWDKTDKSVDFNIRPLAEASSAETEDIKENTVEKNKDEHYQETMELMRKYGGRVDYNGGPFNGN